MRKIIAVVISLVLSLVGCTGENIPDKTPELTLVCGDVSVTAGMYTNGWYTPSGGYEADAIVPAEDPDIPVVKLSGEDDVIKLIFGLEPDYISVSGGKFNPADMTLTPIGEGLYVITARWTLPEKYGGDCIYGFKVEV